ncbi:MAG: ATP-binding protein [Candidatus Krumholzibacteria bacterium]|nr:ATP-binding protein [Candidatus Krumholzibacteria bacterium]
MTIRARLVVMCLVVALLPAVPLTLVVRSLIEKSFDVGLNETIEDALRAGVDVSREHVSAEQERFAQDVAALVRGLDPGRADSSTALDLLLRARHEGASVHGVIAAQGRVAPAAHLELEPFAANAWFQRFQEGRAWLRQAQERPLGTGLAFFAADDRTMLLAAWQGRLLFYHQLDPFFLEQSSRMLQARQLFAKLRLTQGGLARSFFYPFVIIYGLCVLVALALALFMAERLAEPVRRLVAATGAVAGGDWTHHIEVRAGGETGRLVRAFNAMVARLDAQRSRLVDAERMAAWRDVARHLAHEIKNPLLPIRLTVEELRDQYKGDDDSYSRLLGDSTRVVGEELDHLQALVKEFSTFAKMPDLAPREGSLEALARDVAALYPQVATSVHYTGVPPFRFDADQVRRVLVNLYDNAVAVGAKHVNLSLARDDEHAILRLQDDGPGIAGDHIAKLFDPYFTTRKEGTGLGLAMVKSIVLMHGGNVTAANRAEGGAEFVITLPLAGPPPRETKEI